MKHIQNQTFLAFLIAIVLLVSIKNNLLAQPAILLSPSALSDTISSCNDTSVAYLKLQNIGDADLTWQLESGSIAFADDFESGIDNSLWDTIFGGVPAISCGAAGGANALYFNGSVRSATTQSIDATRGGTISFQLKIASGSLSPCDGAETGEDVLLSYSIDNGVSWSVLNTYDVALYPTFTLVEEDIPLAAQNNNLKLMWSQPAFTGSGYDNWSLDNIQIEVNSFYLPLTTSGLVGAGDSASVQVIFGSDDYSTGTHIDTLIVNSNDTTNSQIEVPISLTINGSEELFLMDSVFDFGTVYQGIEYRDTVIIENAGCDTLFITNITSNESEVTVDKSNFFILPYESEEVSIIYLPISNDTVNANLTINSSHTNRSVYVFGISTEPSVISLSDSSFTTALAGCSNSDSLEITIYNLGVEDLTFSTSRSIFYDDFEDGLDNWTWDENWGLTTDSYEGTYALTESPLGFYGNNYDQYIEIIEPLVVYDASNCVFSYWRELNTESGFDYLRTQIQINEGIWNTLATVSGVSPWTLIEHDLSTYVSNGDELKIRFYFTSDGSVTREGLNIDNVTVSGVGDIEPWADLSAFAGTVTEGDSTEIEIVVNTDELITGVYYDTIFINSNDPVSPVFEFPLELDFTGYPQIDLSDTSIDFGSVYLGTSSNDSFAVFNNGCDTLFVTNISSSEDDYITNIVADTVLPNETAHISILFTPAQTGVISGSLLIQNNDVNRNVSISGVGTPPPVISVSHTSLTSTVLNCNDSSANTFTIYNTGLSDLNWQLMGIESITDDFESGIDNSVWSSMIGGIASATCGSGEGTNALYFNGAEREAITRGINTMSTNVVLFQLKISSESAPCEAADAGEEVYLDYSTDSGITWYNIQVYDVDAYNTFIQIEETIPAGAQSENTQFRWRQPNHTGVGYDNWAIDNVEIQSMGYIKTETLSGITSPNDSSVVDIWFDSENYIAGTYYDTLVIASNDVFNSPTTINLEFEFSGYPDIVLSDTVINFDTLYQNIATNDSIRIYNTGCDTLFISNISPGNVDITVSDNSMFILPGESENVIFTVETSVVGNLNSVATIYNNDLNVTIDLLGYVLIPPTIGLSADNLNESASYCDATDSVSFVITNNGGDELSYYLQAVDTIDSTSVQYFSTSGAVTLHTFTEDFSPVDSIYLNVTVNGDFNSSMEYLDIYIDSYHIDQMNPTVTNTEVTNSYRIGVPEVSDWLSDGEVVVQLTNSTFVNPTGPCLHQVELIVPGNTWFDLSDVSDTLLPGESSTIYAIYSANELDTGLYSEIIKVYSNDPQTSLDSISFELLVASNAPTSSSNSVVTNENTDYEFSVTDFLFNDIDVCDTFNSIQITSLESSGELYLDTSNTGVVDAGEEVTLNQVILVNELSALKFKPALDENGSDYDQFSFVVSDGAENSAFSYDITINVLAAGNNQPTDITLSSETIAEHISLGSTVGTFTTIDADISDSHIYDFASGDGVNDKDNGMFTISGSDLLTNTLFDFETQETYNILVSSNDGSGGVYLKEFVIDVTDENDAPTDINLSATSISEDQPSGSTVGTFSTDDVDDGASHTYSLVAGDGTNDADNASFTISAGELLTAVDLDFETQETYNIYVQTDDGVGGTYAKAFVISVSDANDAPTDINLSATSISEDQPSGSTVGTFSTDDADDGASHTYSLVAGDGTNDADNASFTISAGELLTAVDLDFETQETYNIYIQTDDGVGGTYAKAFVISVNDANDVPTDIDLSATSISEDQPSGSTVGTFSTDDVDDGASHTYSLVAGDGTNDVDNASFTISAGELLTAVDLDFETQETYNIYVQTDDGAGGTYAEAFVISVNDANDVPTDIDLSATSISEDQPSGSTVGTFSTDDVDDGASHTYSLVAGDGTNDADNASFTISAGELLTAIDLDFETQETYNIYVQTDDGAGGTYAEAYTISVVNVNDNAPEIVENSFTIDENSPAATVVGQLSSTDADNLPASVSYSIVSGNSSNAFAIDNSSGEISVNNTSALDYETTPEFNLTIEVSDGLLSSTSVITISLNDVNEGTSVTDVKNEILNIYPNPSKGRIHIEIQNISIEGLMIDVYNMSGKNIVSFNKLDFSEGTTSIDLAGMISGIYVLKIYNDNYSAIEQIVIE